MLNVIYSPLFINFGNIEALKLFKWTIIPDLKINMIKNFKEDAFPRLIYFSI